MGPHPPALRPGGTRPEVGGGVPGCLIGSGFLGSEGAAVTELGLEQAGEGRPGVVPLDVASGRFSLLPRGLRVGDQPAQQAAEVVQVRLSPAVAGVDRDLAGALLGDGHQPVLDRVADALAVERGEPTPTGNIGGQTGSHCLHQRAAPALAAGGQHEGAGAAVDAGHLGRRDVRLPEVDVREVGQPLPQTRAQEGVRLGFDFIQRVALAAPDLQDQTDPIADDPLARVPRLRIADWGSEAAAFEGEGVEEDVPAFVEGPVEDGEDLGLLVAGERPRFGSRAAIQLPVDGCGDDRYLLRVDAAADEGLAVELAGHPDAVEEPDVLNELRGQAVGFEHRPRDVETGLRRGTEEAREVLGDQDLGRLGLRYAAGFEQGADRWRETGIAVAPCEGDDSDLLVRLDEREGGLAGVVGVAAGAEHRGRYDH